MNSKSFLTSNLVSFNLAFYSKLFYFSSTQISNIPDKGGKDKANHIHFNAGENVKNFNEKKLALK